MAIYSPVFALLVSDWTHYNYRNTRLKFNSSLRLASLGMLYDTEDNNLTFLSQHPLHLRSNFLRNYWCSIKGIFVSFVQLHLYKVIRSRDTVVATQTDLQAESPRYRGTIASRSNWLVYHSLCLVFVPSVLCFYVHSTSLITCVFRNLLVGC